jgi:hypothetical protein
MKFMRKTPENERRATLAGVNLFFGVLLGANLGAINAVPLFDYVKLVILLSGSVMALYTIAVSKRPRAIWTLILLYGALLGVTIAVPDLRPEGMEAEMERIIATLAIWLAFLTLVRLSPSADSEEDGAKPCLTDAMARDELAEMPDDALIRPRGRR